MSDTPGIPIIHEWGGCQIQYFTETGTWVKPDRAVRVDYLICAGGGGGSVGIGTGGRDGQAGELRAGSFDPGKVPESVEVEIGRGGKGAEYGIFKAGDGAVGYALFLTHLAPTTPHVHDGPAWCSCDWPPAKENR